MAELNDDTVVKHAENAVFRKTGSEIVLLTPEEGTLHVLNDVSGRIWELCTGPASIESIVDKITAEYEVERERAASDTRDTISRFMDLGLVTTA